MKICILNVLCYIIYLSNQIDGGELHEILACRTPMGSTVDLTTEKHDNDSKPIIRDLLGIYSVIPHEKNDEADLSKNNIMKKIAPMLDTIYDSQFEWIYKFPKVNKVSHVRINDVFQLVPHSGMLKPDEVQYVNIIFRPKCNINVRAILECEVLGGPPESIIVSGQSSELLYKINNHKINFKIRSYNENATEQLVLTNIAQLPFEYKTYVNEPSLKNNLYGSIIDIVPSEQVLEPEQETEIKIEMRPGVMGYFHRIFILEIGHLPILPIEVFGWGVIPQVYLSLPRPDILQVHYLQFKSSNI